MYCTPCTPLLPPLAIPLAHCLLRVAHGQTQVACQAKLKMAVDKSDWEVAHNWDEKGAYLYKDGMSQQVCTLFDWQAPEVNYNQLMMKYKCETMMEEGEKKATQVTSKSKAQQLKTPNSMQVGCTTGSGSFTTPDKIAEMQAKRRRVESLRPPPPRVGSKASPPDASAA